EHAAPTETRDLGSVRPSVLATLRETTEQWCESGRHIQARLRLGELSDLISKSSTQFLNPGAHADVILPESTSTASILAKLKALARLRAVADDPPRSSWTTQPPLTERL